MNKARVHLLLLTPPRKYRVETDKSFSTVRGRSRNSSRGGGGGSGPEFFKGGGGSVRV